MLALFVYDSVQSPVKKEPTPNNYNGEYNINTNSFFQSMALEGQNKQLIRVNKEEKSC